MPYLTFKNWLRSINSKGAYKITLDAGFSCPNRDGKLSSAGCVFCDNSSFSPAHRELADKTLAEQIENGKKFGRKFGYDRFIAYFQAFTNTYASIEELKRNYDAVIDDEEIVGLAIGTRPDCVSDEILDLIASYNSRFPKLLFVEFGMQSAHDKTLERINRGHLHQATINAVCLAKKHGLKVVLHAIIGLPGESESDIFATADEVAWLNPHSVKIHHQYVCQNTALAKEYHDGAFKTMEYSQFVKLVSEFIARMPETIVIQRLVGELSGENILAPCWGKSKAQVIQDIVKYMLANGLKQGFNYNHINSEE